MNYDDNDEQQRPQNEANNLNQPQENYSQDSSSVQPTQDNITPYGSNMQNQWNYEAYQKAMNSNNKKKRNKGLIAFIISVCSLFAIFLLCLAGYGAFSLFQNSGSPLITANNSSSSSGAQQVNSVPSLKIQNQPKTSTASTVSGQMTAEQISKNVCPSVVGIVTYSLQQMGELAEGSGIIMSADGYIVTNNHVIDGASSIQVVLSNGKKYTAKVIGADTRSDLAVLKIDATNLNYATFGNSTQLSVGDTVLAIGNPGGLEFADSVTEGIVSSLNRTVVSDSGYSMDYIQTDAAINPGNSGGALVNMYGQIVGINSAKIADVDYEGIGFAIPINVALPIIDDLIKFGYVQNRVKLGITCEDFDQSEAQLYNAPAGLLVVSVDSTSDAAAKGIQQDDIITKVDGKAVTSTSDLLNEEDKYTAGQSITLTICRLTNGSSKTFNVSVKLMEDRGTDSTTTTTSQTTQDQSPNNFFGN